MGYLWIKAFHIIFVVTWFAGLFYIFRLFVYHVKNHQEPGMAASFGLMEKKLLAIVIHPSSFLVLFFGFWLIWKNPAVMAQGWFRLKMVLVIFLITYQLMASMTHKRFLQGDYFLSEAACRIINEVPSVILILTVILAIVKPFSGTLFSGTLL
ncbi:MAG: CopD family protein [Deltaproteobacteria bacterium]|nr:CopD family protein [Deltaproteobacteria bacterium]